MATPKPESIETILKLTRERHQYDVTSVKKFVMKTNECISQDICDANGTNHRICCKDLSNKIKWDRAKKDMKKPRHKESIIVIKQSERNLT